MSEKRVLLLVMPFLTLPRPHLGVALLKAGMARLDRPVRGHQVTAHRRAQARGHQRRGARDEAVEDQRHLSRRPRKPRRARHASVRRYFPVRNRANRLLDPQAHRSKSILPGLSRHGTALVRSQSHSLKTNRVPYLPRLRQK